MKNFLLAVSAIMVFSACGTTNNPGSEPYPVPPGQPVPGDSRYPDQSKNPDQTRYPNPYPSGDNSTTYPAEGQRDGVVTIIKTGNRNQEKLPPGQAKKKYGGKSARVYAPGQQKKNGQVNGMATVISVPDQYASRSTSGQLYYNYKGNTYWKQNDGYYHLSAQQNEGYKKEKNKSDDKDKKEKKKNKKKSKDDDDEDDD